MINPIQKHLGLLGHRVIDRVTGFAGVVDSIMFDLYGCIQATVNPGLDKEKKQMDSRWFDVSRLEVVSKKPVMTQPDFWAGPVAEGDHGPADKPLRQL